MADPLHGIADTHTHPFANRGFGGMLWGEPVPWGNPLTEDLSGLGVCDGQGHGGQFRLLGSDVFVPVIGSLDLSNQALLGIERQGSAVHGPTGFPTFDHWPDFADGLHQQYHVRFIHRAWELGNLRMISMLAVSNRLLSRFMRGPGVPDQPDDDAVMKQIDGINAMVNDNAWMEIAHTPKELRRIVGDGHLAVVVGLEVDELESLRDPPIPLVDPVSHIPLPIDPGTWVPQLVDKLYTMGIRQVTPIHTVNNRFGGYAVYNDLMNTGNQYVSGDFAHVDPDPGVEFKFAFTQSQYTGGVIPVEDAHVNYDRSDLNKGHINRQGLSEAGKRLIVELMQRGMLIDLDHMSENSVTDTLAITVQQGYPVMSSHTFIRDMAFPDNNAKAWAPNPTTGGAPLRIGPNRCERGLNNDHLLKIGASRGMLAPGTAGGGSIDIAGAAQLHKYAQVDVPAGSSIIWAAQYLEAVARQRLALPGGPVRVGLGTDFTLTPGVGPRFGPRIGPRPGLNLTAERLPAGDRLLYANDPGAPLGALKRYAVAGGRTYDFNTDGMAHFGLLPDFLADLLAIGLSEADLLPLYSSAEGYTGMWEDCRFSARISKDAP
jgi:microsomal dipeptidase-like Zn-dependent dipeptidase